MRHHEGAMAKSKADAKGDAGPSKMSLVRDALAAVGGDAKPRDIQSHIQEQSGVEIPTTVISSYKSVILGKQAGGRSARGGGRAGSGVSIGDIEQVQDLIRRHGAGQLQKLIEALDK
jgi:hypothetical protein